MPGSVCKPIGQRTGEVGCWIMSDEPMGRLTKEQVFWHLDVYPTPATAQADKGPRSTVLESLGKIWLATIDEDVWRPARGQRIAKIGPLGDYPRREILSAIYGSSLHTGNDFKRAQSFGTGSLVHHDRRNLLRDLRRHCSCRARRWAALDLARWVVDAPCRYRVGKAARPGADSSRDHEAANHSGPRLGDQGLPGVRIERANFRNWLRRCPTSVF